MRADRFEILPVEPAFPAFRRLDRLNVMHLAGDPGTAAVDLCFASVGYRIQLCTARALPVRAAVKRRTAVIPSRMRSAVSLCSCCPFSRLRFLGCLLHDRLASGAVARTDRDQLPAARTGCQCDSITGFHENKKHPSRSSGAYAVFYFWCGYIFYVYIIAQVQYDMP